MRRYTFTPKQRLKRESEFSDVFKNGRSQETDFFKAFTKVNNLTFSRLGVSVSKRVGNAVCRNRIKRVVREWFRLNCEGFYRPHDVVVIFRKKISQYSNKGLRERLEGVQSLKQS